MGATSAGPAATNAVDRATGEHFSCAMSAVLLARVHEFGGDGAVDALLRRAGSKRSREQLTDIGNWISYEEAIALWRGGTEVTHDPGFARAVGADAARRLGGSPMATLLRSLGSPENVYRQIAITATKYCTVSTLQAVDCRPGETAIVARAVPGYPRSPQHCEWTQGLLGATTLLFGLEPATVEHTMCAAYGAPACHYRITWPAEASRVRSHSSVELDKLRDQLEAMKERLHSVFQTAADLIGAGQIDDVLARIADRAAVEVRAPRHLLAVRMSDGGPLHCHQAGFAPDEVREIAETVLDRHPSELPAQWLVVAIRSSRRDYGRLLAAYPQGGAFLAQERELFEVYARYAASALDSASALLEAQSRYGQSSALLELARALAVAGTSAEVAHRLADAVPSVVDCDETGVYIYDGTQLVREAVTGHPGGSASPDGLPVWTPRPGSTLQALLDHPHADPIFVDRRAGDGELRQLLAQLGLRAAILVPLVSADALLGMLAVAVRDRPERLSPTPDLLDRLSGVGAQAATALQNGHLVDLITHQALHDQLTGLANRVQFTTELRDAVGRSRDGAELTCVFYIDLDRFKPVNDEYGHEAGDALLAAVAERLRACTRGEDVVARLGGDEFAVLVCAHTRADIDRIGRRLAAGFDEPFVVGGRPLTLGASIGRSVCPADAPDADALLRRADAAMFDDKRRHRTGRHDARLPA